MVKVVTIQIDAMDVRAANIDGKWFYCINDICRRLVGGANPSQARVFGIYDSRMVKVSGERELEFIDEHGLYRLVFRGNTTRAKGSSRWLSRMLAEAKVSAAGLSKMEEIGMKVYPTAQWEREALREGEE